jgi:exopolysaccharide biosynthesis protein
MRNLRAFVVLGAGLLLAGGAIAQAERTYPTTRAAEVASAFSTPGVDLVFEQRSQPNMSVYVAKIDTTKVDVVVSLAGADPDGADGPWETVLMTTKAIAEREKLDVAVNADFFITEVKTDAEGKKLPNYVAGREAKGTGVTVVNTADAGAGVLVAGKTHTGKAHGAVVVEADGRVSIREVTTADEVKGARAVVSGRDILVKEGKVLFDKPPEAGWNSFRGKNPRTVAGVSEDGKTLILLVVDGRSERSEGMTYGELAAEAVKQGAWTAVNLDGGGSSTFVVRVGDEWKVVNGTGFQRPIANVIGVRSTR